MVKTFQKKFFVISFSALTVLLLYMFISSNGVILGNDPAVHLSKTYDMLESGKISFSEITWYPPLYRVFLAELILFTGASSVENSIFLLKVLGLTIDWLVIFSVYLLGARLLNKECGVIASFLLLLCFPFYEINFWGGYSSLLSIAYMAILFFYLPPKRESVSHNFIIFLTAFSLVLTHQFATFLTMIVLVLYFLLTFFIFKGSFNRSLLIAIFGALAAFVLWYLPIILPYLDFIFTFFFSSEKQYLNLIWRVTLDVFLLNFGFILILSFLGIIVTFYECKSRKASGFHLLLFLGMIVPLLFTQAYFVNLLLPYDRFVYFLMPFAVVFAAAIIFIPLNFAMYNFSIGNLKNLKSFLRASIALFTLLMVVLLIAPRFPVLTGKISEAAGYYSYMDVSAYEAGLWLRTSYPEKSTIVATEKPGVFFGLVSGKHVFMETDPTTVRREAVADTVLNLAYEVNHPVTLFRVYGERMPYELDQFNVLVHNVWKRAAFLYDEETMVSYVKKGERYSVKLSDLEREIFWSTEGNCKTLHVRYSLKDEFYLTEKISFQSSRFPVNVSWAVRNLDREIEAFEVNLSIHLDLCLSFRKAYVPGVLNWENPWNKTTFIEINKKWALLDFLPKYLLKNYVAVYDSVNSIFCAVAFTDYPEQANIGVLSNGQIDALRLNYKLNNVSSSQSFSYAILAFSEESLKPVALADFDKVFVLEEKFAVQYRDYVTYVKEYGINFLVFDVACFRRELLNSGILQMIYSSNEYVICKIQISGS